MATKVKPSRLQITGTPQAGNVPVYVDQDTFQRGAGGGGGGDVTGPASATDGHLAVFDGATGKIIKDGGAPTPVIDNLNSTSSTSSLSANQGKVLNDKIEDLFGLGKFLSLWDATTGLPISFPLDTPYTYSTGDYFLVETISSATPPVNYKPNGSSYTGTASSTTESDELEVGDVYIYDGSAWLLQSNHGKTVTFANIAGDPYDNTNLANALADKQDELVSGTNIRTINGTSILGSGDITTPVGGDVYGPSSSTDGHLALFDGATGKLLKDGGAVPTGVPSGGTNGQVLTNVNGTPTWANPTGGIQVSPNSTITGIKYVWYGTESDYSNLSQYYTDTPGDTEFHTF